jgi:hypothetical protein
MGPVARRWFWGLTALALAARVVVAFKTYGVTYDTHSFELVRDALRDDPLDLYSSVNGDLNRWPYPPGFFPWVAAAGGLANLTGVAFHGLIQLPQIAADGAIAWLVQDYLGRRGASERVRIAAAALVLVGPSFWIISAYQGQIDPVAVLPAVFALWLWDRWPDGMRRAAVCGLLVGVGAAMKLVPALMLFALLPTIRSRREAVALLATAAAVPALVFAPFVITDGPGVVHTFRQHHPLPGFGGLSLLVQPDLADNWLQHGSRSLSGVSRFLFEHGSPLLAVLLAPFIVLVYVRRTPPVIAATLLFSALLVLSPGFEFHFVVYALPFALMAGYVWQAAALQAALLPPAAILFWHPLGHAPTIPYVTIMIAVWCVAAVATCAMARRVATASYM